MDELRTKCPWDKEQTFESLRNLTIEETFELADSVMKNDLTEMKKELGDLLIIVIRLVLLVNWNRFCIAFRLK